MASMSSRDMPSSIAKDSIDKHSCHANPLDKHFKGAEAQMDGKWLDVSSQVSVKGMDISECHNHSNSGSSYNLFSKNVNVEADPSAPDTSQHREKHKINAYQTTKSHGVNDLGCEGDNISCISKVDGTCLKIGGHDNADLKNVTGSSCSINSLYEYGSERPIHIWSAKHGSVSSEYVSEEGNRYRGSQNAGRAQSVADMSDRSDPSEISSLREEHSGAVLRKVESFSPARGTYSLANGFKANAEMDGNWKSAVAGSKLDQQQSSEMRTTCDDLQEPSMQYRAIDNNEVSEELVDVRICDICGDAGREYLLALCSKCNDGAEHIYCMRIKMDKMPDGDWICEECMVTEKAGMQKGEEQRISGASQKSSTNEVAQSSIKLNLSGDNGRVSVAHALAFSRNRCMDEKEVCHSTKKRALDKDMEPQNLQVSYSKEVLPRHVNSKTMSKGEALSFGGSKSRGNILWKDCQPSAGSKSKRKCSNGADLRTLQESQDVYRKFKAVKGSQNFEAGPQHTPAELEKSNPFTASSIASLETLDSMLDMQDNFKVPMHGSKCGMTQGSKATPALMEVKKLVALAAEARWDLERATVNHEDNCQGDTNVSGSDEKIPCSTADNAGIPGNFGSTSVVCSEHEEDWQSAVMKARPISEDLKCQSSRKGNIRVHRVPPRRGSPLEASAHPDVACVWRGTFNLKECNKLPVCCPGLQAHLSTSAPPIAHEAVRKFPSEMTVNEVLQRDILPAHLKNVATEDKIALYFFADDLESYRSYKEFLNCMVLNDLALTSILDGVELLIFPSQILPARSHRWNNLSFLWGVFRAEKLGYPGDACIPRSFGRIGIPLSDIATSPDHPGVPNPSISAPANSKYSSEAGGKPCVAAALLGSAKTSGVCSQGEPRPSVSTKCMDEVDVMITTTALMRKEQYYGGWPTTSEVQEESRSHNKDREVKTVDKSSPCFPGREVSAQPTVTAERTNSLSFPTEEMHLPDTNMNHLTIIASCTGELELFGKTKGGSVSLNSGPFGSDAAEIPEVMEHSGLSLKLSLRPEPKPANEGDLGSVLGLPNQNARLDSAISLDLSLALPTTDDGPLAMMEEPLPDVDTSLCLFGGSKRAC